MGDLATLGFAISLLQGWSNAPRSSQSAAPLLLPLALADRWLPQPRVLHPYPAVRFTASHPR